MRREDTSPVAAERPSYRLPVRAPTGARVGALEHRRGIRLRKALEEPGLPAGWWDRSHRQGSRGRPRRA